MACELVTGSAGTDHVSSADDGSMFASVFGPGRYAVKQGNDLAATLVNSNTVQVETGAGFIDGRYFRVTSAETLTIDSGAQGYNRIDLVGFKYEYDSGTQTETGSLAVVKGTATSGTPSAPTYTDGDINAGATEAFFPLYSIEIDSITPSDPVKLFKTLGATVSCPWPVGAVLQMTNGNNPNDIYPGTTWQEIQGRFLLGSSSSYTLGNTGGAATVTLTTAQLPSHSHGLNSHTHTVGAHTHGLNSHTHTYAKASSPTGSTTLTTSQIPSHTHTIRSNNDDPLASFGVNATWTNSSSGIKLFTDSDSTSHRMTYVNATNATGGGTGHTHTVSTSTTNTGAASGNTASNSSFNTGAASGNTATAGSGSAHDNMPPYKVVNMWERTA